MLSFSAWLKGGPSLVCLGNRLRVILYFTSQAGTWLLLPGVDWGQERLGQGTVDSENWWKKHKVEQPKASQGQLVSSIRLLPFVASSILCLQACLDGFSATKSLDVFAFLQKKWGLLQNWIAMTLEGITWYGSSDFGHRRWGLSEGMWYHSFSFFSVCRS